MPAWSVDGMDVLAVEEAARRAAAEVRDGGGPYFLELRTYRFRAHSMYDPDLYRTKDEIEHWKQHDPIPALDRAARRPTGCWTTRTSRSSSDRSRGDRGRRSRSPRPERSSRSRTSSGSSTGAAQRR